MTVSYTHLDVYKRQALCTGCSRDPNIRKQKYLDSGEKYAAEGKYLSLIHI